MCATERRDVLPFRSCLYLLEESPIVWVAEASDGLETGYVAVASNLGS